MPNLLTLLQRTNISWDVPILSECWLRSERPIPYLDNYSYITTTSHKTQNEGVVIYYKNQFNATYEEPVIADANCLLLKLNTETCIIGISRPPSQINTQNFIESLELLLQCVDWRCV